MPDRPDEAAAHAVAPEREAGQQAPEADAEQGLPAVAPQPVLGLRQPGGRRGGRRPRRRRGAARTGRRGPRRAGRSRRGRGSGAPPPPGRRSPPSGVSMRTAPTPDRASASAAGTLRSRPFVIPLRSVTAGASVRAAGGRNDDDAERRERAVEVGVARVGVVAAEPVLGPPEPADAGGPGAEDLERGGGGGGEGGHGRTNGGPVPRRALGRVRPGPPGGGRRAVPDRLPAPALAGGC